LFAGDGTRRGGGRWWWDAGAGAGAGAGEPAAAALGREGSWEERSSEARRAVAVSRAPTTRGAMGIGEASAGVVEQLLGSRSSVPLDLRMGDGRGCGHAELLSGARRGAGFPASLWCGVPRPRRVGMESPRCTTYYRACCAGPRNEWLWRSCSPCTDGDLGSSVSCLLPTTNGQILLYHFSAVWSLQPRRRIFRGHKQNK
jgi:hypothetical protein